MQRIGSRHLRLERFAWLAIALVVVRVLGWELHLVVEKHQPGESCEVCLVAERTGDALASSHKQSLAMPAADEARGAGCEIIRSNPAPCPPARGPPSHHG
jgi:hypothetical protein